MNENVIHRVPIEMPSALPAPEPGSCLHNEEVNTVCRFVYLEDTHHYTLELRATCVTCGIPFRFVELPHAILITRPSRDMSGITASLPLVPDEELRKLSEFQHDWPQCEEKDS